jgi:hypothetical protein
MSLEALGGLNDDFDLAAGVYFERIRVFIGFEAMLAYRAHAGASGAPIWRLTLPVSVLLDVQELESRLEKVRGLPSAGA